MRPTVPAPGKAHWHSGWPGQAGPGPSLRKRVELDGDERIRAPARRWRARRRV